MDLADGHIAALRKLEDCKIGMMILTTPFCFSYPLRIILKSVTLCAYYILGCEVYNLGTGNGTSVLEMVDAFEKASGKVKKTMMLSFVLGFLIMFLCPVYA